MVENKKKKFLNKNIFFIYEIKKNIKYIYYYIYIIYYYIIYIYIIFFISYIKNIYKTK